MSATKLWLIGIHLCLLCCNLKIEFSLGVLYCPNWKNSDLFTLVGTVISEGSWHHRSYINDITIVFISEKEFFIFNVFYSLKTQFLFFSILNFPPKMRLAGVCYSCAACLCGIENSSHITMNIRRGQHPLVSFKGVKTQMNIIEISLI